MSLVLLRPLFRRIEELAPYIDQGYAILTPNRRLGRAIRQADDLRRQSSGQTSWSSPVVAPERQYWSDVWRRGVTRGDFEARRLLDVPTQRLLWQQVIERQGESGFSLLNPRRAASLCQEASERLLQWRLDPASDRLQSWFNTDDDARTFLAWRDRFNAQLAQLDACTPGQAHHEVLTAFEAGSIDGPPALLRVLCDDASPLHLALAERAAERIDIDLPLGRTPPTSICSYEDPEPELHAAARWCRESVERCPNGRFAVVLQDMQGQRAVFETLLRREFGCLTTNYDSLPVNFATGFSLAQAPLIRDALRALGFAARQVDLEECLALLTSRFIEPLALAPKRLEQQVQTLRELAADRIPGSVLRDALSEVLGDSHLQPPWEGHLILESRGLRLRQRHAPSVWVAAYRELLNLWGWATGVALDSLEFQQHSAWHEALDAFAMLDGVLPDLGFEAALLELRLFLTDRPFQPQTADRAVQVLGPLETSGLSFDGLWLTGMDAGTWPERARPNPYIPTSVQRSERMPGADAALAMAEAFRRSDHWQSCTKKLFASFVKTRDDAEQLPSPIFATQGVKAIPEADDFDPRWHAQARGTSEEVGLDPIPIIEGERVSEGVGGAALEAQAACPFKAFAQFRLATTPRTGAQTGLLPWERGTILHHALHRLFSDLPRSRDLRDFSPEVLETTIAAAVAEGRNALKARRRLIVGTEALDLEGQRLHRLLRDWLAVEKERGSDYRVVAQEVDRTVELGGLTLNLRIDRVDELDGGGRLVIDYKSGRPETVNLWFTEPPVRTQMPLYAVAEPEASAVIHAIVRPGESQWRGVGDHAYLPGVASAAEHIDAPDSETGGEGAEPNESFAIIRDQWRESLTTLAAEFVTGESAVDPLDGACRACGRHRLCRIGDAEL